MPRIKLKSRIVPADINPFSKAKAASIPVAPSPQFSDGLEKNKNLLRPSDGPAKAPVARSRRRSSVRSSKRGSHRKSALSRGARYLGSRISNGASSVNGLLLRFRPQPPRTSTRTDNVFDLAHHSNESINHYANAKTIYGRTLEFSGADTIAKLGAVASESKTLKLNDVELTYAAQTLLDLSRGKAGTQDLFIGDAKATRENTGGHVTKTSTWMSNPVWFKESMEKLYRMADSDIETTRLLTTFITQKALNDLIYNLQDGVNRKLNALIIPGDPKMSWRVYKDAPFKGAAKNLCVRATVEGKIAFAEVRGEMVPQMGSFRASTVINLSRNTAWATLSASLDSKKLGIDTSVR